MPIELQNKVTIRIAEPDDLPEIFKVVDCYDDREKVDYNKVKNSLRDMLYMQSVLLAHYNGVAIGGVGGYVLPCMFNDDIMFCTMFFYIKPEFRYLTRSVVKEIELALMTTKVTKIFFGVWGGETYEKQKRFMQIMGYKLYESHMVKAV